MAPVGVWIERLLWTMSIGRVIWVVRHLQKILLSQSVKSNTSARPNLYTCFSPAIQCVSPLFWLGRQNIRDTFPNSICFSVFFVCLWCFLPKPVKFLSHEEKTSGSAGMEYTDTLLPVFKITIVWKRTVPFMSKLLAAGCRSSTELVQSSSRSLSGVESADATHQDTLEGLAESYWLSSPSHSWQKRGDRSGPLDIT